MAQLMVARRALGDFPLRVPSRRMPSHVTNVVMMGQGEPLFNFRCESVVSGEAAARAGWLMEVRL